MNKKALGLLLLVSVVVGQKALAMDKGAQDSGNETTETPTLLPSNKNKTPGRCSVFVSKTWQGTKDTARFAAFPVRHGKTCREFNLNFFSTMETKQRNSRWYGIPFNTLRVGGYVGTGFVAFVLAKKVYNKLSKNKVVANIDEDLDAEETA